MPSSVISKIKYNPDSSVLRITYVSGIVYDYKAVPEEVYEKMKISGSKGRYLNKHIKGRYDFEKIN